MKFHLAGQLAEVDIPGLEVFNELSETISKGLVRHSETVKAS
jgi:hypothetical protein